MSILIKGMEMPKRCEDCPCMCEVDTVYQTACGCKLTMKIREIDNDTRPDWCPLVPVPDHGRLIDADELYKRAKIRGERFNGRFDETDNVINALYIENFPTVIPADKEEQT